MDLAAEMLLEQWSKAPSSPVAPVAVTIRIPPVIRRLSTSVASQRTAFNMDRALARYLGYPVRAALARRPGRMFHVVDHSYAQLLYVLPSRRTGVFCHDLDVLQPTLRSGDAGASWRDALAWTLVRALRSAAVVFHNSEEVGRRLESNGVVPASRLVHAPLGVAAEFQESPDPEDGAERVLAELDGRPFVLHVGSEIPRKRLDVVFDVFARLHAANPEVRLVQQGANLSKKQRAHVDALGIRGAVLQPPWLDRATLAGLYRRAALVLVTSEAEGFGLPVLEALACGAVVLASDIPVLREVGGRAVLYAPVGDVAAWTGTASRVLCDTSAAPPRQERIDRSREFTWARHAQTILETYRELAARRRSPRL